MPSNIIVNGIHFLGMSTPENAARQISQVEVGLEGAAAHLTVPFRYAENGTFTINALDLWSAVQATPGLMSQKVIRIAGIAPLTGESSPLPESYSIADDRIVVVPNKGLVTIDGHDKRLTPRPLAILTLLARNRDLIVERQQIQDKVWGPYANQNSNNIDVVISGLRKTFGEELGDKKHGAVRTAKGLGWRAVSSLATC